MRLSSEIIHSVSFEQFYNDKSKEDENEESEDLQDDGKKLIHIESIGKLIEKAKTDSQKIIDEARLKYSEILKEAERKASIIERESMERGEEIGRQLIWEEEQEKINNLKEVLNGIIMNFNSLNKELVNEYSENISFLAIMIAKKILNRELILNEKSILEIIKNAFSKVMDKREVIIRINCKDFVIINKYKSEILEVLRDVENLRIEKDDNIQYGGCKLETMNGVIDAQFETQIQEALNVLGKEKLP